MMTKHRTWLVLVGLSMLCGFPSLAQQNAIGQQNFGSFSGGPDVINLGNLNVHLSIPVLHKQGRGIPFIYDLTYDSTAIWSPVKTGSVTTWTPQSGWGWSPSQTAVGYIAGFGEITYYLICNPETGSKSQLIYRAYSGYVDVHGTLHHAPGLATTTFISGGPGCNGTSTDAVGKTDDGSGYTISVLHGNPAPSTGTVTSKSGVKLTATIGGGATVGEDNNGNEITFNSANGQFFDTLSATTPVLTVTGFDPVNYTYTPPSGTPVSVVVSYKSYPVQTHFQCSTVTDYGVSAPIYHNLVDRVKLADGTFYQFTYEPTIVGSQNVTGRLASVTLPTGSTISYAYTGNNGGINCPDGSTLGFNRTTPDSATPWKYSRSGSNPNWTTTVIDPLNNTITYAMYEVVSTTTNGPLSQSTYTYYETNRTAPGETTLTCYNGNFANCASGSVSLPISQVDSYRTLGTKTALSESIFDTSNNNAYGGRLKEQKVYDFGVSTGSAPSNTYLLTDSVITYASLTGITDHPSQITVMDAGGHTKSQTTYAYDAGSVTTTSAPQHVAPPNSSRGNLTSVSMWTSGTSTLSKSFTYYDTGNVNVATDVNGATTTFTYGDSASAFATQTALSPVTLTRYAAWNNTGGVQTSYTDENGNVASKSYTTDPYYWRPEYATDLAGNQTNFTYPSAVEAESALTFNNQNSVSDHRIKLDALGRASVTQTQQGPNGNYDSVETTYDALGRRFFASLPYSGAAGALCSGSCPGTSTSYDSLGRVQTVSDSGGGSVSYTYPNNDVYQSIGPAPAGEATKDKQMEYDGAGRLTSVCEVLSSGGTSCGQNSPASGYKTSYAYSVPAAGGGQMVVTQGSQTRTYVYDGLDRLISETNPESSGIPPTIATTYVYDSDPACTFSGLSATSNGDLISKTDANGNKTCYSYDSLHRVTDIAVLKNGACYPPVKRFRYDTTSNKILTLPSGYSTSPNASGRMIEAWDGDCTWRIPTNGSTTGVDEWFAYSPRGEMTDLWASSPQIAGYYHGTATYAANGALSSLGGVPGYTTITYGLDGEGRLNSATQGSVTLASSTTYNAAGQPRVIDIGNSGGDTDNYAYDPNTGRMTNWTFTVGSTPKSQTGTLTWNPNGTLQQLVIGDGFNTGSTGGSQTCKFGDPLASPPVPGYDDLERLVRADCASAGGQTFSYDQYGNLSKSANGIGVSWTPGYDPATNHASLPITYDNNGNLIYDTLHHYAWYVDNKLASTDSTTCTIFGSTNGTCILYDAFGREVERGVDGSYTEVMYTPVGKTAIMNGEFTTLNASFPLPGGATYYQTGSANGSGYFWHKDWLGSVRLSSSVLNRTYYFDRAFAPTGEMYKNFGNAAGLNFTGDTQDSFTGLYDTPNRELHPGEGRWLSPDPAGLGAVALSTPQSWNRYAYVGNNPLLYIDPTGLFQFPCSLPGGGCWNPAGNNTGSGFGLWNPFYLLMGLGVRCTYGDCQTLTIDGASNIFELFGIGGSGTGGGGPAKQVNKTYPKTFNCNTNAAGVMQQVESNFSQFGNYNGGFGPGGVPMASAAVAFGPGPVTQGGSIPISTVIEGPTPVPVAGYTFGVSVTVASVSQNSFTFNTDPGHVLYPASITFSASDSGSGQINFLIQVSGGFSGLGAEIGYYLGGNNLESNIWNHFEKNVQAVCAGQPTGPG